MHRILIVEDDPMLVKLYESLLTPKYELRVLGTGKDLVMHLKKFEPALIVLDVNLGTYEDGFDLAAKLQKNPHTKRIPILFVTGENTPDALFRGLRIGAEDFLVKPFQPFEFLARCEHRIRKSKEAFDEGSHLEIGPIRLDLLKRGCFVNEEKIDLAPSEFQVLLFLIRNKNRNIEREELFEDALGSRDTNRRLIDSYVSALRKKIPFLKDRIKSIYSVGYHLMVDSSIDGTYSKTNLSMKGNPKMLNVKVIDELRSLQSANGQTLLIEFGNMFLQSYPIRIEKMESFLTAEDFPGLEHEAHTLKSSCGHLGAETLESLVREVEALAKRKAISSLPELLTRLKIGFSEVQRELTEILKSA